MTIRTIDESQRKAARVVGFTYLLAMATAVFAEMYVRGQPIVPENAVETARNIMAQGTAMASRHRQLSDLLVGRCRTHHSSLRDSQASKLKPCLVCGIHAGGAAIGVAATLNSFDVLRLLSGADYLKPLGTDQSAALAKGLRPSGVAEPHEASA